MGNRRFAQLAISDDEDNAPPSPARTTTVDEKRSQRKRKKVYPSSSDNDDDDKQETEKDKVKLSELNKKNKSKKNDPEPEPEPEPEPDESEGEEEAEPIGEVISVTGKGKGRRNHYEAFEHNGIQYRLEDPVLLAPENEGQKPYVAIIKDISQTWSKNLMVTGQWFYRPEEAEKKTGGNWQPRDTRELFYSFHRDDVPAESVFHKCVVHFIPLNKQIPYRKLHPGFIVQKVYDTEQRKLFKLTDKDYEDAHQNELDLLVQKTRERIGEIPDLDPNDTDMGQEEKKMVKRLVRKRNVPPPLDVSRENEGLNKFQSNKAETPTPGGNIIPEYYAIMLEFKVLTGEIQRDKWLEKLLQSVRFVCDKQNDGKENSSGSGGVLFEWPSAAVPAVADLERTSHETFSGDFQKYNQKMRQLVFNLKSNAVLARRLLKRELESAQILNMSPNELKEGLTAEEIASREPEESGHMQMTDARCKRCMEKKVGLIDIIQAGHGDRYQLECVACGNTWYASRDDVEALTIEGPSSAKNVGPGTLATTKFEEVEKILASPRGEGASDKGANDVLKKATTEEKSITQEKP